MHSWLGWIALSGIMFSGSLAPSPSPSPVADALRNQLQTAERNLVATATAMPADKYAYKPTPGHMSFGQHLAHLADFNETMCALIGGAAAPQHAPLPATAAKALLVSRLRESFAFCSSALATLNDDGLDGTVSFYGSPITRASAILILAGDWADHYAVTATYLRLNGLLPPTAHP
jgi:hypothetical protein